MRIVAIDWSGDRGGGQKKKIWTAESSHGCLRDLRNGRTREGVADHLIELAQNGTSLLVGFDFAFSMPAWFVRSKGATGGEEFWGVVEDEGEGWLAECPSPFFGHKGTSRPQGVEMFRRTDRAVPLVEGRAPKSVFQIAGGGQVGPGSIRGMPILRRLSGEGFCVWPFHTPVRGQPLVVEIYPRLLTGAVVKSDPNSRLSRLGDYAARMPPHLLEIAAGGEDQFDAAISAAVMDRYSHESAELAAGDEIDRLEGRIWHPNDAAYRPGQPP